MSNSTRDISSHSQQNPNPYLNQVSYMEHKVNNISYSDIAKFLMSNDDEDLGESILQVENNNLLENMTNYFDGSLSSVPLTRKGKPFKRELKKYKEEEEFRFAFRTKTDLEFMDDGYKWRKYGKKMVKNNPNPRNYFKCSSAECNVKKRVERDGEDHSYVITTYHGMHNHETPNCVLYCSPEPSSLLYTSSI